MKLANFSKGNNKVEEIKTLGLENLNPERMVLVGQKGKDTWLVELSADECEMISQYHERMKKKSDKKNSDKIMNIEVTELERKLLTVISKQTSGDCNRTMTGVEDGHAWFGFFDQDFTDEAAKIGIVGKEISGIASSLKKKGLIEVYVEENYFTGRYNKKTGMEVFKKCKAFEVLEQTLCEASPEYAKQREEIYKRHKAQA